MSHFDDLRLLRQELAGYDARLSDDDLPPRERHRLEGLRIGVLRIIDRKLAIIHTRS